MTSVLQPEFQSSSRIANALANHNRLAVSIVPATGDVFTMGSNRVLNGDNATGSAYQRPLFVGRNTLRAPGQFEMNARYSRLFPIKDRTSAEFIVESTNITNRLNVTSVNSTASVDPAGNIVTPPSLAPTASRDQRLLQLGFRFNW